MKKVLHSLLLLLVTCSVSYTQKTPTNSVSMPITLEKNMIIVIPRDKDMFSAYEIDANGLTFECAEEKEKYFSGIKDGIVSYTIDIESDKLYLVLNKDYINKHKWKIRELNDHLAKRVAIMKEHYKSYYAEAEE